MSYGYPLLALFVFGLLTCGGLFRFYGPRIFTDLWFERSLYTWGWVTGVVAMALALLRIVDPDSESSILDDFARAYVALGPLELVLVSVAPALIMQGHVWGLALSTATAGVLTLVVAARSRWPGV